VTSVKHVALESWTTRNVPFDFAIGALPCQCRRI